MTGQTTARAAGGIDVIGTRDFKANGGNSRVSLPVPAGTEFALIDFIFGPSYSGHSFARVGDDFVLTTMVEDVPSEAGRVQMTNTGDLHISGYGMEYTTRGTAIFYG